MDSKFRLSESNKFFYVVSAFIVGLIFALKGDRSSYAFGYVVGTLFSMFLWPLFISWIAWLISGKKGKASIWTFNIVLGLSLSGQVLVEGGKFVYEKYGDDLKNFAASIESEVKKQEFKRTAGEVENPGKVEKAYDEYIDSLKDQASSLAKSSSGKEKQYYEIMEKFTTDSNKVVKNWQLALTAAADPEILDCKYLTNDKAFNKQRIILLLYLDKTKKYQKFFDEMVEDLDKRLSVLGKESRLYKDGMKSVKEKVREQKVYFVPLMKAHVDQGNCLVKLLDLLRHNTDDWYYENSQVMFNDSELLDKFNGLIRELQSAKKVIHRNSAKLVETL